MSVVSRIVDSPSGDTTRLWDTFGGPVAATVVALSEDPTLVDAGVYETISALLRDKARGDIDSFDDATVFSKARDVGLKLSGRDPKLAGPGTDIAWERWEVRRAISMLNSAEASLLRYEHLERLTMSTVAARLGTTADIVETRSHSAHRRLVLLLDPFIAGGGPAGDGNLEFDFHPAVTTAEWHSTAEGMMLGGSSQTRVTSLSRYLAGTGDDTGLAPGERTMVDRLRDHLSSPLVWVTASDGVYTKLLNDSTKALPAPSPPVSVKPKPPAPASVVPRGRPTSHSNGRSGPDQNQTPLLPARNVPDQPPVRSVPDQPPVRNVPDQPPAVERPERPKPPSYEPSSESRPVPGLYGPSSEARSEGSQSSPWIGYGAVVLVVALVALLVWSVSRNRDELGEGVQWEIEMLPVSELGSDSPLTGASATLVRNDKGLELVIKPEGLTVLANNGYYAVWLYNDTAVVPAGSFQWASPQDPVHLTVSADPAMFQQIVITRNTGLNATGGLGDDDETIYFGTVGPADAASADVDPDDGELMISEGSN